jgi:hypothetical protein
MKLVAQIAFWMAIMSPTPTPTEVPKGWVLTGSTLSLGKKPTAIWMVWIDEGGELHTYRLRKPVTITEGK